MELTSTTIAQMLLEQYKATPDAIAVISGQKKTSYRELFEYSWALAHDISTQLPNDNAPRTIGLFLDPSLEHIVAVLALAQLNITMLPLDPSYPSTLLQSIVSKAAPDLVLTSALETRLPSADCKTAPIELKKRRQESARIPCGSSRAVSPTYVRIDRRAEGRQDLRRCCMQPAALAKAVRRVRRTCNYTTILQTIF